MIGLILFAGVISATGSSWKGMNTSVGTLTAVPSWSSYMTAVWNMDQASGATRTSGGSCGSTCDLSDNNTVNQSTSIKIEGTASADLTGSTNYLSCTNATCGSTLGVASSGGTGGSISFGCWAYPTSALPLTKNQLLGKAVPSAGNPSTGYELDISGNLSSVPFATLCIIDSTVTSANFKTAAASSWVHVGCVFDDTNNVLSPYADGTVGTTLGVGSITGTSADFYVGKIQSTSSANGGRDFSGNIDECFVVTGQALSAASMCRICSCGVDGSLCSTSTTDNTIWADTGRNLLYCNGCTLPASPQTLPY